MENAADALKMAGSILIFVLAASIVILAFGQAREASDTILNYRDRETEYIDGNYYYPSGTSYSNRQVGIADIVPTVSRAYLENYMIIFIGLDSPIYTLKAGDGTATIEKYSIDLSSTGSNKSSTNISLSSNEQKIEFLKLIMYGEGNKDEFNKKNLTKYSIDSINPLVEKLNGKVIKEYLGVYYEDDEAGVPDSNKTEKRIITYVIG